MCEVATLKQLRDLGVSDSELIITRPASGNRKEFDAKTTRLGNNEMRLT